MKLVIGPWVYDVVSRTGLRHDDEEVVGLTDHDALTIYVDSNLPGDRWLTTLWHELIHALDFDRSINLTEDQVDSLANGIVRLGKDNAEVLRWDS